MYFCKENKCLIKCRSKQASGMQVSHGVAASEISTAKIYQSQNIHWYLASLGVKGCTIENYNHWYWKLAPFFWDWYFLHIFSNWFTMKYLAFYFINFLLKLYLRLFTYNLYNANEWGILSRKWNCTYLWFFSFLCTILIWVVNKALKNVV